MFARDLKFLEIKTKESAITAKTFKGLGALPLAMDACKSLLQSGPNLKKVGKQMADFKKALDGARGSLKDLRKGLEMKNDISDEDLFGTTSVGDPKVASAIAAKKQAREARLASRLASSAVTPVESGIGASSSASTTDIDAITALIDEERKKK